MFNPGILGFVKFIFNYSDNQMQQIIKGNKADDIFLAAIDERKMGNFTLKLP